MGLCIGLVWIKWIGLLPLLPGVFAQVEGDVRLSDGSDSCGRIDVYYNNQWGTVCSDHFNHNEALVVCRQLGYDITNSEVRSYTRDAHPDLSISLHYVTCTGAESTLSECSIPHWGVAQEESCMNDKDAWVDCKHIAISSSSSTSTTQGPPTAEGSLRLTGSEKSRSGRLELFLEGAWGTVCDRFGPREAEVACRQLNHPFDDVSVKEGAQYGVGSGRIWQVDCSGSESKITDCSLSQASNSCHHGRDVGVICGYSDENLPSVQHDREDTGWKHYYIVAPLGIFILIGWAIYARCNKKARMKRNQRISHNGRTSTHHRHGCGTVSMGIFTSSDHARSRQSQQPKHCSRHHQAVSHAMRNPRQFNPVETPRQDYPEYQAYMGHSGHELQPAYTNNGSIHNQLFTTQTSGGGPMMLMNAERGNMNSSEDGYENEMARQQHFFHYQASAPKPPAYETEFEVPLPPAYDEIYPVEGGRATKKSGSRGTAETNL